MAKKKVKEEDTDGPPEQPSSILGTLALPALDQIPCNSIGSCALALTEIIAYNIVFLLVSDSIHLIGVFSYFDDRGLEASVKDILTKLPSGTEPVLLNGLTAAHNKLSDYYYKFDASPYYLWASLLDPRIGYTMLKHQFSDDPGLLFDLEDSKNALRTEYETQYAPMRPDTPAVASTSTTPASDARRHGPESPKNSFADRLWSLQTMSASQQDELQLCPVPYAVFYRTTAAFEPHRTVSRRASTGTCRPYTERAVLRQKLAVPHTVRTVMIPKVAGAKPSAGMESAQVYVPDNVRDAEARLVRRKTLTNDLQENN
ncbi:hypothetical protein C8R45DRAFT_944645 [Mycena sanguinolenta]|nr:hypothetical protein C8R45DRAFT_944645 [Mycena sanguinolenta]